MVLVVYFFFIYLDDEGCEWMMVVVWKVREIVLKIKKIWHFNEMKCEIDNLMWMFWKVYVQAKLRKDETLYFLFFSFEKPPLERRGEGKFITANQTSTQMQYPKGCPPSKHENGKNYKQILLTYELLCSLAYEYD